MARASQAPAGPDDPKALRFHVLDVEYSWQGYHALSSPMDPPGPWYLCVYSLVAADGEPIISPGLESRRSEPPWQIRTRKWSSPTRSDRPGSPVAAGR